MAPVLPPPHDAEAPETQDFAAFAFAAAPVPPPARAAACLPGWLARLCGAGSHDDPPATCEADPPRLARMTAWLVVLLAGYLAAHGAATRGLPSDGRRQFMAGDIGADVGRLFECGVVLGWLLRVDEAHRFRYLARNAAWLLVLFFGAGPVYSTFNAIPALQISLADMSRWGAGAWAALGVGAALVAALLLWHAAHAWRTLSRRAFAAYLASRLAPFAFYGIAVGAARAAFDAGKETREPHLHHAALALAVAAFGRFNRPVSAAVLAIAAGIFVQGIGAYGFDPMVVQAGCRTVTMPSFTAEGIARASGCTWDYSFVGAMTRLRVCPADMASLAQSLSMRCRKAQTG